MPGRGFPDTRPSIVRDALDADPEARARALEAIARAYWTPIHAYIQLRWHVDPEAARDATQEFFAQALNRGLFHRYDPARSRFRTYLRLCLDSFLVNEAKARGRLKRGGGGVHLDLDDVADIVPSPDRRAHDELFDREWMRALFAQAVDALRAQCERTGKGVQFAVFHRYDIEEAGAERRSTYAELAEAFDLPVTQVTNYLAWSRRQLRERVLEALRAQCGSEEEFRSEAQQVFGVGA